MVHFHLALISDSVSPFLSVFPLSEEQEAEIGTYLSRSLPPTNSRHGVIYDNPYRSYSIKKHIQEANCAELLQQLTDCSNHNKDVRFVQRMTSKMLHIINFRFQG